jgi:pyroglutamyl-peptidase
MPKTILLTSFTTWEPHQKSNAADDLLLEIIKTNPPPSLRFLRQLPVDFQLAPAQAIAHVNELRPDMVICCGMAESRSQLSLEARAVVGNDVLYTPVNLEELTAELLNTEISHDAGQYVCNALYYAMLHHLQQSSWNCRCLFVHVPVLHSGNLAAIVTDFQRILEAIADMPHCTNMPHRTVQKSD